LLRKAHRPRQSVLCNNTIAELWTIQCYTVVGRTLTDKMRLSNTTAHTKKKPNTTTTRTHNHTHEKKTKHTNTITRAHQTHTTTTRTHNRKTPVGIWTNGKQPCHQRLGPSGSNRATRGWGLLVAARSAWKHVDGGRLRQSGSMAKHFLSSFVIGRTSIRSEQSLTRSGKI